MMPDSIHIIGNSVVLGSEINFDNAVSITHQGMVFIAQLKGPRIVIDCTELKQVDHSVLSICLSWHRQGLRDKKHIDFLGLDADILKLFELTGLSELIHIKE